MRLWEKDKTRNETISTHLQGKDLPNEINTTRRENLPQPLPSPVITQDTADPMIFDEPEDRSHMSKATYRKKKGLAQTPASSTPKKQEATNISSIN